MSLRIVLVLDRVRIAVPFFFVAVRDTQRASPKLARNRLPTAPTLLRRHESTAHTAGERRRALRDPPSSTGHLRDFFSTFRIHNVRTRAETGCVISPAKEQASGNTVRIAF